MMNSVDSPGGCAREDGESQLWQSSSDISNEARLIGGTSTASSQYQCDPVSRLSHHSLCLSGKWTDSLQGSHLLPESAHSSLKKRLGLPERSARALIGKQHENSA